MDVTRIAQDVLELIEESGGGSLPEDLNKAERLIRQRMQEGGAKALEMHLAGRKLGYEGSSRPCGCGRNQRFLGYRPRTVATTLGNVTYQRAYYHCSKCGQSCCPYDRRIGLGREQEPTKRTETGT